MNNSSAYVSSGPNLGPAVDRTNPGNPYNLSRTFQPPPPPAAQFNSSLAPTKDLQGPLKPSPIPSISNNHLNADKLKMSQNVFNTSQTLPSTTESIGTGSYFYINGHPPYTPTELSGKIKVIYCQSSFPSLPNAVIHLLICRVCFIHDWSLLFRETRCSSLH